MLMIKEIDSLELHSKRIKVPDMERLYSVDDLIFQYIMTYLIG